MLHAHRNDISRWVSSLCISACIPDILTCRQTSLCYCKQIIKSISEDVILIGVIIDHHAFLWPIYHRTPKAPQTPFSASVSFLQELSTKWALLNCIPCRTLGPDLQPLLSQPCKTRPRSKSKPDEIFIHPAESNIARADAVALELGLGGNTERVTSHHSYSRDMKAWETGKGRDIARQMLAGPAKPPHSQRQSHEQFFIGKGSDSDSD